MLAEVDSTNAEAARVAGALTGPEWILALNQIAGRGRRGRAWQNPRGNFAATLVMQPDGPPDQAALRSFVAALALFDAFVAVTGRSDGLALKWPNDVLLNGGKVAGILLESLAVGGVASHLAIGIGVNLVDAPDNAALEAGALRPVSLASETGCRVSPEDFLTQIAAAFATREASLRTYGFEPTRTAWLDRAAKLGDTVTARAAGSETTGVFETVDPKGNLVLSTPQGRTAIAAADVYFA